MNPLITNIKIAFIFTRMEGGGRGVYTSFRIWAPESVLMGLSYKPNN